ncbi:hypothetical protein N474_25595 [Pseudoalteromonas luteoviolacea CPMOR-2]|uniref:hypothetical protein n=1 Tax=Pseudoalteromonas luteoviolacea TaxID=43657 RepID=UPI0007B0BDEB|nr:hypothetical protein [Pseudoalteromonas luteoviolacea]KZN58373.1 hypothetical protein N474_25595 [Pseudoalteromonas luteoviolacea CPMOR-2]
MKKKVIYTIGVAISFLLIIWLNQSKSCLDKIEEGLPILCKNVSGDLHVVIEHNGKKSNVPLPVTYKLYWKIIRESETSYILESRDSGHYRIKLNNLGQWFVHPVGVAMSADGLLQVGTRVIDKKEDVFTLEVYSLLSKERFLKKVLFNVTVEGEGLTHDATYKWIDNNTINVTFNRCSFIIKVLEENLIFPRDKEGCGNYNFFLELKV